MSTLLREQKTCLNHALKFPQAKYVAYFTRSNMPIENNDLVQGVLDSRTAEAEDHPEIHQYEIDSTSGNRPHEGLIVCIRKINQSFSLPLIWTETCIVVVQGHLSNFGATLKIRKKNLNLIRITSKFLHNISTCMCMRKCNKNGEFSPFHF